MIVEETFKINEKEFIKRYSDQHVYIRKIKVGGNEELYEEANDPIEFKDTRKYEETDIAIPEHKEPTEPTEK